MHSVRIELAKVVGTRITYQATGTSALKEIKRKDKEARKCKIKMKQTEVTK